MEVRFVIFLFMSCEASKGMLPPPDFFPDFDLISESYDAAKSIMAASDVQESSVILITDRASSTNAASLFAGLPALNSGVNVYCIQDSLHTSFTVYIRESMYVLKNPLMIVASDKEDTLSSILNSLFEENLLVWTTRLLVVTRLPIARISKVKNILSTVNGMVMTPANAGAAKGWSAYIVVPYSYRPLEIAKWTPKEGLKFLTNYPVFPNKFNRFLDGGHLKVAAEFYPPHAMLKENFVVSDEDPNPFFGPVVDILDILVSTMNFTYSVSRPPDGAWGYLFPNGTWNGMVGMLDRKEMDLGLGPFNLIYSRAQVMDYTAPLMTDYGRIMARKGETEINPWGFYEPLTRNVWLLTILSLIVVILASSFLTLFSGVEERSHQYSAGNYVKILLGQDMEKRSIKEWSRSVIVGTWMIAILVLMKSYSGNLWSLLIVRLVPQPYHTVRAVVDDPRITVLIGAGGSYQQIIYSIPTGVFKELADAGTKGKISYLEFTRFNDAIGMVAQGTYVLMSEDLALKMLLVEHFTQTGSCIFYLSKERFFPLMVAMGAQKYGPLTQAFDKRIVSITESGLFNYWIYNVLRISTLCINTPTKILVQSSLSLSNLWGMFATFGGGCLISCVIFILELVNGYLTPKTNPIMFPSVPNINWHQLN